ncbi:hypothetical protein HNY73_015662, partial [Argiope bruennichi]
QISNARNRAFYSPTTNRPNISKCKTTFSSRPGRSTDDNKPTNFLQRSTGAQDNTAKHRAGEKQPSGYVPSAMPNEHRIEK